MSGDHNQMPKHLTASYEGDDLYTGEQLRAAVAAERERYNALLNDYHGVLETLEEMQSAVAAEREACARVCDDMVLYTGYDCAAAIRARGQA